MATSIQWVDDEGLGSLTNGKSHPAHKFTAWTPKRSPVGPPATRLGSGRIDRFVFRTDDLISFRLDAILGTEANLLLMMRLQAHLLNGGVVLIEASQNPLASNWETATLAPETEPEIQFSDTQNLEYSFVVTLLTSTEIASTDVLPPTSEPSFEWWFDARQETVYVDNDDVGTATDFRNDHDATVPTGWKPKYKTEVTPTLGPAFQFLSVNGNGNFGGDADSPANAGEPQYLKTTKFFIPTDGTTIFTVMRRINTHIENAQFWRLAGDSWSTDNRLNETHNDPTPQNPGNIELRWLSDQSTNPAYIRGIDTREWLIHCIRFESGSVATQFLNGTKIGSFDPSGHAAETVCMMLGTGADCEIAEQQGFVDALSDAKVAERSLYLSTIHGITLQALVAPDVGALTLTGFAPTVTTA